MSFKSQTLRAFLALLLLSMLWGYNWVVMKDALNYAGAFQFGALRTFLGSLCLLCLLLVMRQPLFPQPMFPQPMFPQQVPTLILLGVLQTSGFTGLIIWAPADGGTGKTAVLSYTMPFWVMVLAWPLLGEKLKGAQWLAAGLSVLGLLFILDPLHLGTDRFSMLLAVLGGIFWALSVIVAKRLHRRAPDLDLVSLTAWQMLVGSLPIVLAAWLVPAPPIRWTASFILDVFFNAVFCNALAWMLWLYALKRLQAGIASMTSMLAPVIGVLAAWWQLGEQPSRGEAVGMLLIGASLLFISLRSVRKREQVDPAMGQE